MSIPAAARFMVVLAAAAAALLPLPASWIERWYSNDLYPRLQIRMTTATNAIGIALLDALIVAVAALVIVSLIRRVRRRRKVGWLRSAFTGLRDVVVLSACVYLVFLFLWGLNYRRVPLERKVDYVESRVTPDAARELARASVLRLNQLHAAAHANQETAAERTLEQAFRSAQQRLGAWFLAVPGVPKRSVLEWYFQRAAIDGMTDPFFLEVILNPDVLPFERPFVLAHEWGHLAGYADESEASLLAWLTCLEGDERTEYSGWLAIYSYVIGNLPRSDARTLAEPLQPGPRADLAAISARVARSSPVVRTVARDAYDAYLKANRVEEGIASYDAVVRLILGAGPDNRWAPRARPR
jgi:hypothetical protein